MRVNSVRKREMIPCYGRSARRHTIQLMRRGMEVALVSTGGCYVAYLVTSLLVGAAMLTRILGWAAGFLIGMLALSVTAGGVGATILACDTTAFSGQVTKAGSPLTVRSTDGKERAVSAGPGLVVIRNGNPTQFNDVHEGDQVNVTVPAGAADCAAARIEVSSPAFVEKDRTGLWGLLGLLGLAGLLPLLRRQPRPVQTTERVVEYPAAPPVQTVNRTERVEHVEHVERLDPSDTRDTDTRRR